MLCEQISHNHTYQIISKYMQSVGLRSDKQMN